MRFYSFLLLLLIIPFISSCKKNHYRVNTSGIDVSIQIKRLEKDLFTLDPENIKSSVESLRLKYGDFLQLFSWVINTGGVSDSSFGVLLTDFCTDRQNNEVFKMTMELFPDLKKVEAGLEEAFRHYLYYYPGRKVPSVFSCITGFNNSIITGDSILGISLDRYLGADCKYYPRLEIYNYIAARMTPAYIVSDCVYGWGASEWDFSVINYEADNVLTEIIHLGKLKYFEKCLLPEESDEIIFGFTSDQVKFCKNNESQMWLYLIEQNLLFSSDQFTIRKLTGEAPFTSFFTNESPGRAAVWLGFRIVESYMMRNKDVAIESLMNDTDIQSILEKSKYSPQ